MGELMPISKLPETRGVQWLVKFKNGCSKVIEWFPPSQYDLKHGYTDGNTYYDIEMLDKFAKWWMVIPE